MRVNVILVDFIKNSVICPLLRRSRCHRSAYETKLVSSFRSRDEADFVVPLILRSPCRRCADATKPVSSLC